MFCAIARARRCVYGAGGRGRAGLYEEGGVFLGGAGERQGYGGGDDRRERAAGNMRGFLPCTRLAEAMCMHILACLFMLARNIKRA